MNLDRSEGSFSVNQLVALNHFLFLYKGIGIALALLCLVLGIACNVLANRNPIVVIAKDNEYSYYQGHQKQVEVNEKTIRNFVEAFVMRYYSWSELDPMLIYKNIEPFIADDIKESTLADLKTRKDKVFFGKKIQQSVVGISVVVDKDSTIVIFDVVMRVDNIPLIVPTEVALRFVKGIQTEWNPVGIYVSSITTHEGK